MALIVQLFNILELFDASLSKELYSHCSVDPAVLINKGM